MSDTPQYKDIAGNPVTLNQLVRLEPEWAANQIRHRDKLSCENERLRKWSEQAHAALQGAEVLVNNYAEAKVTLADSDQYGILTPNQAQCIRTGFLDNNDNVQAILEALRTWPTANEAETQKLRNGRAERH